MFPSADINPFPKQFLPIFENQFPYLIFHQER